MKQKTIYLLIILIIAVGVFGYWLVNRITEEEFSIPNHIDLDMWLFPSERAERFSISGGGDYPLFIKEIIIDPAASSSLVNVTDGDKQIYSVWVKDPEGIEEVTSIVETDKGEETIEMQLVQGTKEEGRWMGSWTTKDISLQDCYRTIFRAINSKDDKGKTFLPWCIETEISKDEALRIVSEKYPAKFYSAKREVVPRLIDGKETNEEVWLVEVDLLEDPIMSPGDKPSFKIEVIVGLETGEIDIYKMYD